MLTNPLKSSRLWPSAVIWMLAACAAGGVWADPVSDDGHTATPIRHVIGNRPLRAALH